MRFLLLIALMMPAGAFAQDDALPASGDVTYDQVLENPDDIMLSYRFALKQIEDGSYGYCDETGDPIGIPRLLARPTATLSLEAQERRERVQKMFGD